MSFIEQWLHDAVPPWWAVSGARARTTFAVDNPATGESIAPGARYGRRRCPRCRGSGL